MLEAERLEQQRQPFATVADQFLDPAAQRIGAHIAGVDPVRGLGQRAQQLALHFDRFHQRGVVEGGLAAGAHYATVGADRQRMAPARLGVALHQRVRAGREEQHLDLVLAGERTHGIGQLVERLAAADVGGNAQVRIALAGEVAGQFRDELRRQVVHAVVPRIFEDVQRDGLAGTGNAGDEDDAHSN
ncbi:hypothetical protein D3C72_1370750 [compost metagenome]